MNISSNDSDLKSTFNSYKHGIVLVSGATKSGKSLFAEKILNHKKQVIYIATLIFDYNDSGLSQKIKIHRDRRPSNWETVENYQSLAKIIDGTDLHKNILIDSLGGFVFQHIEINDELWAIERDLLLESLSNFKGLIVVVSEETGWGVSPSTEVGNIFRDRLGEITIMLAKQAFEHWLLIHGKAINLTNISYNILN